LIIFGVNVATPFMHVSSVQSFPSFGVSMSSACDVVPPLPSHTADLQSPATCKATDVPDATGVVPHVPAVHDRTRHSLPGSGQSMSTVHSGIEPLELDDEVDDEDDEDEDVVPAPPFPVSI
jgi:hypothetical protein